jgi:hypothetical protein
MIYVVGLSITIIKIQGKKTKTLRNYLRGG